MKFIYSEWETFCKTLSDNGLKSVTASTLLQGVYDGESSSNRFITLKHDVEASPSKALDFARIEHKYGHCASYYVQAYLMTEENYSVFSQIQELGHEVSYHHDVIDGAGGDLSKAVAIYNSNLDRFKHFGFDVKTVCQHGNPVSDFDNRDFFRSNFVQELFPQQVDIMVNFMHKIKREYIYISDFGMSFKIVNDPTEEQKIDPSKKHIELGDASSVVTEILTHQQQSYTISTHPHRYNKSLFRATCRRCLFKTIRCVAKALFFIPGLKKFLFRFHSLTKYL